MDGLVEIGELTISLEALGFEEDRARRVARDICERLALRLGRGGRPLRLDRVRVRVDLDEALTDQEVAEAIARAVQAEVAG